MTVITDDTLTAMPLGRAVAAYLDHCRSVQQLAKGTQALYRCVLDVLVEVCGSDMPTHTLNPQHIAWTMDKARKGDTPAEVIARAARRPNANARRARKPSSLNTNISVYRQFTKFCQQMRWLSPYRDPCVGLRPVRTAVLRQNWVGWTVPVSDRAFLLEMAGKRHPRDRFVCALGLFGGRRTSDIANMRVADIDLDGETFTFTNEKSGGVRRTLPIMWPEFMVEIRRWLAWYAGQHGELAPQWHLVPRRLRSYEYFKKDGSPIMEPDWPVMPTEPADNTGEDVKRALELIGAPVERGGFGMHVLRHSCAVWLMDTLGWDIYDVTAWLDHANVEVTRGVYLRGTNDIQRLRDRYQKPGGGVPPGRRPTPDRTMRQLQQLAYTD